MPLSAGASHVSIVTLKITPRNRKMLGGLSSGVEGVNKRIKYVLTIYVHIGVVNSERHDSPHIRKLSLITIPAEKIGGVSHIFPRYILRLSSLPV